MPLEYFEVHPTHPQLRLIDRVVKIIHSGGVVVFPTDSAYAIGCHLGDKEASERIRAIRQVDPQHHFTLMCRDLSQLATYAKVDNPVFRILKAHTPGPYTFILPATREIPRRLAHPKRKTIGLRVPEHVITQTLLKELHEPLMSMTLVMPHATLPITDIQEIREKLENRVDAIIDGGACGLEPTTVVDLTDNVPQILRQGKGEINL